MFAGAVGTGRPLHAEFTLVWKDDESVQPALSGTSFAAGSTGATLSYSFGGYVNPAKNLDKVQAIKVFNAAGGSADMDDITVSIYKVESSGGGGATTKIEDFSDYTNSGSTSAYAAKGIWIEVDTEIDLQQVMVAHEYATNGTYKVVVVQEDGVVDRRIGSVIGESAVLTSPVGTANPGWTVYTFATPLNLPASTQKYGVFIVRTDATTTSAIQVVFSTNLSYPDIGGPIVYQEGGRVAANATPSPGDDWSYAGGSATENNAIGMRLMYS